MSILLNSKNGIVAIRQQHAVMALWYSVCVHELKQAYIANRTLDFSTSIVTFFHIQSKKNLTFKTFLQKCFLTVMFQEKELRIQDKDIKRNFTQNMNFDLIFRCILSE